MLCTATACSMGGDEESLKNGQADKQQNEKAGELVRKKKRYRDISVKHSKPAEGGDESQETGKREEVRDRQRQKEVEN